MAKGGRRPGAGRPPKVAVPDSGKPGPVSPQDRDCAKRLLEALNRPARTAPDKDGAADSFEVAQWRLLSEAQDLRIRLDVRKYLYDKRDGKAAQPIVGDDQLPPVQINISAIPMKRERA